MNTTTHSTATADPAPLLLTAQEVVQMLSVSKSTLWRMRDSGKLPAPIRVGGIVRWRASDIQRWVEQGCPTLAP